MKIVISPAKSLDYQTEVPTTTFSEPALLSHSEKIQKTLKKKSAKSLSKLMHISDNLGQLNFERNQEWQLPFTSENSRQAIYAFKGTVYEGLDAYTIPKDKIDQLQNKLRILSGLYGVLKPLDLMQAYRLEMGTKLKIGRPNNLYQFWDTTITDTLNVELDKDELFVNLASNEYFKAVKPQLLKVPVTTPIFKDYKNGKLKVIAFFAKKARGMMVRYILDKNVETIDGLKGFNVEGYAFDANLSSASDLIFTR